MPSAPNISFDIRPSRWLVAAVCVMALLALVAVSLSRLPDIWRVTLGAVIGVYAAMGIRRLTRDHVIRVGWLDGDELALQWKDGREGTARLVDSAVLGPLIMLRLAWADDRKTALLLLPDNVDADTRRRIRARLSAFADAA